MQNFQKTLSVNTWRGHQNISQPEELRQKTNKNVIVINCAGLKRPCVICDMRMNITMTLNESKAVTLMKLATCDKALMYAFQQKKRLIDVHMVRFVAEHEMLKTTDIVPQTK